MCKYGILGEADSDRSTLKVLIRRLHAENNLEKPQFSSGPKYTGHGEITKKGARDLRALFGQGYNKFIIARDADKKDLNSLRSEIISKVIGPSRINDKNIFCIVIPVQAIEAWLLADITKAISKFPSWVPCKDITRPESILNPKEEITRLISKSNGKSLYNHVTDNEELAKHISLELLAKRCPSFKPLEDLVIRGKGNL